jgi:hypothetical protein
MSPIEAAFKTLWSEAQTLYLPDKLYVEISGDGTLSDSICRHDGDLLRRCERGDANGIVFLGSTFGSAFGRMRAVVDG